MAQNLPDNTDIVTGVRILRPAHGGTCFAHANDKPIFVSGAIPGEVVDVRIDSRRSRVSYGTAVNIVEPSQHRQPHIWPEGEKLGVGGADLGHVTPAYQRQWKSDVIKDQLSRVGGADTLEHVLETVGESALTVAPATGDETGSLLNRRTRVDFEVSPNGRLAMKREASNELVEIETMPLADESILELGLLGDSAWRKFFKPGKRVRAIAPNAGGRRVLIGNQTFNASQHRVEDQATWEVEAAGYKAKFEVHTAGFWQAHRSAPQDLVELVLAAARVQPGQSVIELYSGAGLLTKFLAHQLGSEGAIISVEGSRQAVADARRNMEGTHAERDIRSGRIDGRQVLRAWSDLGERPDVIVLDPPRSGAGRDVVKAIGAVQPKRVVLVSCDPAAGARDIKELRQVGYSLETFHPIDLFPQTHHLETVAVLSRKSASKSFIPVSISPKDMGLSEEKEQPTYANIRDYVQKTHGMKVSSLYVAQMKAECGLETQADRSGDKKQPKCPPEKREAILDAFRHFGLIGEDGTEE
ncbi:MAG: TRAM domain-containing protein [Actinomycetaceae bacterium]|nr:TRAM domain-containing protein [Actinomycetaceae bacterium]